MIKHLQGNAARVFFLMGNGDSENEELAEEVRINFSNRFHS